MYFYDDDFELSNSFSCTCDYRCDDRPPSEDNPTGCTNCDDW